MDTDGNMNNLTVLGGHGFVGSRFWNRLPCSCESQVKYTRNDREDHRIYTPDVLNFISTVHNYHIFTDPYLDIDTNLSLLIRSLEEWRERDKTGVYKTGVYNFISSWFVYGGEGERHDVEESAICDPRGFYSITKRAAEQLLISYCDTYGLSYRILRLGNVIGPGDMKASKEKNAIQYLVNQLKNAAPIQDRKSVV